MVVPIGHYATGEMNTSTSWSRILELRDTKGSSGFWGDSSVRLQAALEQALPPAARFQVVWSRGGTKAPPSRVALLLGAMTLDEKVAQLGYSISACEKLSVKAFPHGIGGFQHR